MTLQSCFCLAIAQVYNNEGEKAFLKKDYSNAVYFATEGIKVNCKDEYGMAILYSNRANAHLHLGELMCCCCCFFFLRILGRQHLQSSRGTGFAFRSGQYQLRGNKFNSMLVNSQRTVFPHPGWPFKSCDKFG